MFSLPLTHGLSRFWGWITHIGQDSIIYPTAERIQLFALCNVAGIVALLALHYREGCATSVFAVLLLALLLVLLLWWLSLRSPLGRFSHLGFYSVVMWYCLPLANTWIYIADGYSRTGLLILLIALSVYYLMAEWWHVLLGSLATIVCCYVLTQILQMPPAYPKAGDWVLLMSAHACWLGFSLSSHSKRDERLRDTQALVRHMQRGLQPGLQSLEALLPELRYALTQAAQASAQESGRSPDSVARRLARADSIVKRLQNNTIAMEDHLGAQCVNARFFSLEGRQQLLRATEIVRAVVENYPYTSERFKATVQIEVQEDFQFIGVREQWAYALRNVLDNAFIALFSKGTNPQPGDVRIVLSCEAEKGRIQFFDRGCGLTPQALPYIFEPFYAAGRFSGIGLGLSYTQAVVEGAGGRITIRGQVDRGCAVQMTLPRVQEGL